MPRVLDAAVATVTAELLAREVGAEAPSQELTNDARLLRDAICAMMTWYYTDFRLRAGDVESPIFLAWIQRNHTGTYWDRLSNAVEAMTPEMQAALRPPFIGGSPAH